MTDNTKTIKALEELRDETRKQLTKIDTAIAALRGAETGPLLVKGKSGMAPAEIRDAAVYVRDNNRDLDFSIDDLVMHDDMLTGLVNKETREQNLRNIWDKNIRPLTYRAGEPQYANSVLDHDEALAIAENTSKTGIATTTLSVAQKASDGGVDAVSIHIVRNSETDKTLVVGEKISSKLYNAFKKANIKYVDRTSPRAAEQVEKALDDILDTRKNPYLKDRVMDAFLYRNDTDTAGIANRSVSIGAMLTNGKVEPMFAKYVVKVKP